MNKVLMALLLVTNVSLMGCKTSEVNVKSNQIISKLGGTLIDGDRNGIPMSGVMIKLFEQYQPLTAPKSWREIAETKTNAEGYFQFSITVEGPYQIEWYPEGKKGFNIESVPAFEEEKVLKIEHTDKIKTPWGS